ncbi:cache domain-containing sensor histidine kinase [Paenibacillus sp. S-38]|uniref:cache domain-containing sensor histidine kinase n=1 Tax=Paenibacillus sp. S-38 TaxID=3416710 RepID=UPI003CF0277E
MTNPFKQYRVDRLFFRSFAALIIAVLAITAVASFRISSKELATTTSYYQQQLLGELNNEIAARLVTVEQISLSTSRDGELISFLTERQDGFERLQQSKKVAQTLANLTYSIPLIQGIDLYMDRPVIGDPKNYIQFRDLSQAPGEVWFEVMKTNDYAWSSEHTVPSVQGDVAVLSFSRNVMTTDSRRLGVLIIHVKADTIRAMLAGHAEEANRVMLDDSGSPLLKSGDIPLEAIPSGWLDPAQKESGYARLKTGPKAADTLLVYSKSPDTHWTIVEVTPWSRISAGSYRLAEVIALIGVAAVVLTLLLTHWLSRQFTKPIKLLLSAMGSYTPGRQKTELPEDYRNEFGVLFSGYRKQNERIEELYLSLQRRYELQRQAEIEALQANINPHFLYNTLDQLNWMAIAAGQGGMSRILELMGRMFRIGLSNGSSFISIGDELLHVESYLEIQQLRWGSGLEYEIEVPSELKALYIPKLTLQPFIENSVTHGFHGRREGRIRLSLALDGGIITVRIEDNGCGLRGKAEDRPQRPTGGYGIRNVRERLLGYFGEGFGVMLEDREEGGTRVTVRIPELPQPPAPERPAEP